MKTPTLHALVGIPGSGKSTLAHTFGCKIVSSDSIREELTGSESDLSRDNEVWNIFHLRVAITLLKGHDVVADATHLSPCSRLYLQEIDAIPHRTVVHFVSTEFNVCVDRNAARDRNVPFPVMQRMYVQLTGDDCSFAYLAPPRVSTTSRSTTPLHPASRSATSQSRKDRSSDHHTKTRQTRYVNHRHSTSGTPTDLLIPDLDHNGTLTRSEYHAYIKAMKEGQ